MFAMKKQIRLFFIYPAHTHLQIGQAVDGRVVYASLQFQGIVILICCRFKRRKKKIICHAMIKIFLALYKTLKEQTRIEFISHVRERTHQGESTQVEISNIFVTHIDINLETRGWQPIKSHLVHFFPFPCFPLYPLFCKYTNMKRMLQERSY